MTAPTPRPLGEVLRDALPTYEASESLRAWARAQAANCLLYTSDAADE